MRPISFVEMKRYPQTLNYLKKFKKQLSQRKGFTSMDRKIRDEFFYTLQRIGVYTFHPYKVGWKYISKSFTPCVFSSVNDRYLGKKLLIPNEKIIYIGFKNESEAFYLCGLLSSFQYKDIIQNYIVGTQITPGIIKKLNIKKYDQKNIIHVQISQLCMRGHESSLQSEKDFYQAKISER